MRRTTTGIASLIRLLRKLGLKFKPSEGWLDFAVKHWSEKQVDDDY